MIGNIAFTIMIIFQLSGALILLFGNLKLNLSNNIPLMIYGNKNEISKAQKSFSKNAYKTMYINRTAGAFLTIGYTASIWASLSLNSLYSYALVVVGLSLLLSWIAYKLIEKISDKKSDTGTFLPVGTVNIGSNEDT